MLGKAEQQRSFSEEELKAHKLHKGYLAKIDRLIDWRPLDALLQSLYPSAVGRPSHPPLVMFKGLLLAQWYKLSDPGLEEAINDRLSFRHFLGLSLAESVPDETSFCRFRNLLAQRGLMEPAGALINQQLDARGLLIKQGTLIDATLVEAAPRRPGKDTAPKDPQASYTKRQKKIHYGYKAHIGVDQGSGLVRKVGLTGACVHDSHVFDELLSGDEAAVFADKAYDDRERRQKLQAKGVYPGILEKGYRNHPLTPEQKHHNKILSRVRSGIERIFGTLKRVYRWQRVRYLGLKKNLNHLYLLTMAYNLKRMLTLETQKVQT